MKWRRLPGGGQPAVGCQNGKHGKLEIILRRRTSCWLPDHRRWPLGRRGRMCARGGSAVLDAGCCLATADGAAGVDRGEQRRLGLWRLMRSVGISTYERALGLG